MRLLPLSGSLPASIAENTAPWDWFGQLRLTLDPAQIRFVDLLGPGGDFFDVTLNRALGTLEITPYARADYEAFSRAGTAAVLSFDIRFFMADGSIAQSAASYAVAVTDRDDTPPQALSFASGGTVAMNAPGAVIGTLAVTDPDTASGFTFRLRDDDAWLFEISGDQLRLKPGMVLAEYDGPVRSLFVEASDGTQSAGFELRIGVTNPALPQAPLANLISPGERIGNFSWSGSTLVVDWALADMASMRDYGAYLRFTLRDGREIWTAQPQRLDLLDADISFDVTGAEGRLWALFETALGREPRSGALGVEAAQLRGGLFGELYYAFYLVNGPMKASFGALTNEQFVRRLYDNVDSWYDDSIVAWHRTRLDAGFPRENLLLELVNWRRDVGWDLPRAGRGFVTTDPGMHQLDALLRFGLGEAPGANYRALEALVDSGALPLGTLANYITTLSDFAARWGSMDATTFARSWYAETRGSILPDADAAALGGLISAGALSRGDYMVMTQGWWGADPYALRKPQGDFDFSW